MIFRIRRDTKSASSGAEKFTRDQYKSAWNSASVSEDDAKISVSGYTDESKYASTANDTLGMLTNSVGVNATDVVLEIGAGVGRVGAVLAPLCKEWIGVDVSSNMLKHLSKRLAGFPNVRAVESSGYDLAGIPDNSVDLVYCTVVFMHLDEWDRYSYIHEGFRILRPGGRMLVDNVNLTSDAGWAFFEEHRKMKPSDRSARISKTSTPDELRTYFMRAGYSKIEQREWGLFVVTWGVKA